MASRQWLKENPKVLSYVPKSVYQRLKVFTDERRISISQAVVLILEEYFELESEYPFATDDTQRDVKLEQLEQEFKELTAKVAELKQQLGENRDSRTQPTLSDKVTQVSNPNSADGRRPLQTIPRFEVRRQTVESDSQTDASEEMKNQSQTRSSLFDYPPQNSQNASVTEEKDIPIYQTTSMPKRRTLRTEAPVNGSKNQSYSPEQKHPLKEQVSSENNTEGSPKRLLGRLGFPSEKKADDSGQRSSVATRPALPPPSAH